MKYLSWLAAGPLFLSSSALPADLATLNLQLASAVGIEIVCPTPSDACLALAADIAEAIHARHARLGQSSFKEMAFVFRIFLLPGSYQITNLKHGLAVKSSGFSLTTKSRDSVALNVAAEVEKWSLHLSDPRAFPHEDDRDNFLLSLWDKSETPSATVFAELGCAMELAAEPKSTYREIGDVNGQVKTVGRISPTFRRRWAQTK